MRGKARKKRKSRYAKLNGGRYRRFIYVKLQGEKNSRKSKVINMEYIIIGLKLKLKKKRKNPQTCKSPT